MAHKGILPPMPASDQDSLDKNRFDGFYKIGSRDFWGENEINRIPDSPMKKCQHEFINIKGEIRCSKCNFGLLGSGLVAIDGQVYAQGKPIKFA